jgi:competence protein ComEA
VPAPARSEEAVEQTPDWRPIEAAPPPRPVGAESRASGQLLRLVALALAACAALAVLAAVLWVASPQPELVLADTAGEPSASLAAAGSPVAASPTAAATHVVVDVEGAVRAPGLYALPDGSRVGDAIAAAGGYAAGADLDAAAQLLNLAELLTDGDKILVPRLGATTGVPAPSPPANATASGAPAGLINLNTADQATLETLPGIGPVTAAKIIAARTEAPFVAVEELAARGVIGPATLEKITALVTVGP